MSILISLEFPGLPPTVNHLYRSMRGGRRYKTPEGRDYQEEISGLMREAWGTQPPYTGSVYVCIEFTSKTRRAWDIDNRLKALQDCLEISGVIKNDAQIDVLHVSRGQGKKDKTRITVTTR